MNDVMTHVFANTTVTHNGYTTVNPGTLRNDYLHRINGTNSTITSGVGMLNRLDETNYYTNGSGTV